MKKTLTIFGMAACMVMPAAVCAQSAQEIENFRALEAENYVKKQLKLIEHSKPLSETDKQKLTERFVNRMKSGPGSYIGALTAGLSKITNDTAYFAVLLKDEIENTAKQKAKEFMTAKGLTEGASPELEKMLYVYRRELALTYRAFTADPQKRKLALDKVNGRYKPLLNNMLLRESKLPFTNYLGLVISNKDKLAVSAVQLDSLYRAVAGIATERLKTTGKNKGEGFNLGKYEYRKLKEILKEEQISSLLQITYADKADKAVADKMQQIRHAGLDKEADVADIEKQLLSFYLNTMVLNKNFVMDKAGQQAVTKRPEIQKPEILTRLEAAQRNARLIEGVKSGKNLPFTNYLGLAITHKDKLAISAVQLDSLHQAIAGIFQQRAKVADKNSSESFNLRKYEHQKFTQILNEAQINALLKIAFNDKARETAAEKIQQIKQEGLDKDLNMENLQKQLFVFYLNTMVARERFAFDKDKQRAQIKSLDVGKPRILTRLAAIQRNEGQKDNIKSVLMW